MKTIIKNTLAFRSTFYVLRSTIYVFRSTFYTNVIVVAIILALFASCSKYEDGPWISFRSAGSRINGSYVVQEFTINNIDITDYYKDSCNCEFVFEYTGCYSCDDDNPSHPCEGTDGKITLICPNNNYNFDIGYDTLLTTSTYSYPFNCFNFSNGNKGINALLGERDTANIRIGMYPFNVGDEMNYFEILRLTKDELWLRFTDDNSDFVIKLLEQ